MSSIASGDELIGFTRAFLYAGAKGIMSSLWKVSDTATNDLMVDFYERSEKSNTQNGLRDAKLKMINSDYSHPYYWAAFQYTGLNIH